MSYPYQGLFAIDPGNPSNVALNADVLIFDPNDPARNPLPLTDSEGLTLLNPLSTNDKGFIGMFYAPLDQIGWSAGELVGLEQSFIGLRDLALAASDSSAASAAEAGISRQEATEAREAAERAANMVDIPAADAVAEMVNTPGSLPRQAMDENYARRGELFVNVRDFGAVGDGVTDDSAAFNAAMEAARDKSSFGGCTVTALPAGDFRAKIVRIYSDTTVDLNFSTFRHTGDSGYIMFCSFSGGPAGYGSGGTDITLRNIKFQGDFSNGRGCANVFHHVDRLTFDHVTFTEALGTSGHPADIMGCRSVRMFDCAGFGRYEVAGRAYVEMFQIDHSARSNAGSELPEADTAWDGLPCYDVVMERCKSEPITIGSTTYLAPRLIGSHSRIANLLHDKIVLRDISVTDTGPTGSDGNYRGGVHFTHTKGLLIDGYTFTNTRAEDSAALGIESVDTTYPLSSVASASPVADTALGSVACGDVVVKNFRAYGANHELASSLILVAGKAGAPVKNVSIEGQAVGFHSGNTAALDQGATIVDMNRVEDVDIRVRGEKVSRLVNVTNSGVVTVEMQGKEIMHSAIRASSVEVLNLPKATLVETVVAGYLTAVNVLNITAQMVRTKNVPTPVYTGAYNITGCTNVKTSGNTGIRAVGGGVDTFFNFYGGTTKASAENTQGTGFANVVSINANSTVTEVGTQTYAP